MVKAIKYKINICTDFVHNYYVVIDELFIPETNVIVNFYETLNIFSSPNARYLEEDKNQLIKYIQDRIDPKPIEIDIPEELVKQLVPRSEDLIDKVKALF